MSIGPAARRLRCVWCEARRRLSKRPPTRLSPQQPTHRSRRQRTHPNRQRPTHPNRRTRLSPQRPTHLNRQAKRPYRLTRPCRQLTRQSRPPTRQSRQRQPTHPSQPTPRMSAMSLCRAIRLACSRCPGTRPQRRQRITASVGRSLEKNSRFGPTSAAMPSQPAPRTRSAAWTKASATKCDCAPATKCDCAPAMNQAVPAIGRACLRRTLPAQGDASLKYSHACAGIVCPSRHPHNKRSLCLTKTDMPC